MFQRYKKNWCLFFCVCFGFFERKGMRAYLLHYQPFPPLLLSVQMPAIQLSTEA